MSERMGIPTSITRNAELLSIIAPTHRAMSMAFHHIRGMFHKTGQILTSTQQNRSLDYHFNFIVSTLAVSNDWEEIVVYLYASMIIGKCLYSTPVDYLNKNPANHELYTQLWAWEIAVVKFLVIFIHRIFSVCVFGMKPANTRRVIHMPHIHICIFVCM